MPVLDDLRRHRKNKWESFIARLSFSGILYPFTYAKVLIQIGHEPIPGRPGKSIFGHPVVIMPNAFEYIKHIKNTKGTFGACYNGVIPRLIGYGTSEIISDRIAVLLGYGEAEEYTDAIYDSLRLFITYLNRNVIVTVTGIVVSHPFYVITIRTMAQFVGGETLYNGMFNGVKEVYRTDGILGFYGGVIPRLIGNVSCLVASSCTIWLVNRCILGNDYLRVLNAFVVQCIFGILFYPYQVVSTCCAVAGAQLVAGQPPFMPVYPSWRDCFADLKARGELNRYSGLLWRYKSSSTVEVNYIPLLKLMTYL